MRRSRPPVYRGKNIVRAKPANGRKHWKKQKLASILHFRRQPEEEVALIEDNYMHTYVLEALMEDGAFFRTEDNAQIIFTN